jgi:hypothetical protein
MGSPDLEVEEGTAAPELLAHQSSDEHLKNASLCFH